ncbi:site-specific integrase [Luteimonas sp. C4P040a]|nr:site-specific integrase [Luteimonas fraxinea]
MNAVSYDAASSHDFEGFLSRLIEKSKRKRTNPSATRYLEHIPHTVAARLLSSEAEDYLKDMSRRNLSRSSLVNQRQAFRFLKLAAGDIPVSLITCDHIREFYEVLRCWPQRAGNKDQYARMSDEDILAEGKKLNREPPALATMQLYERQITAFFNRLIRMRVISSSPLDGFGKVKKSLVKVANTRRAFTDQEITDMFSETYFIPWASRAPHKWWGPLIGLFTGARVTEVAQLKVADIINESGAWCFNFQVTADDDGQVTQMLKGEESIRIVPVARQLLELGFLEFIEDIKAYGHPRLFPNIRCGINRDTGEPNGVGYGAALSQQYSAHLRKTHSSIEKGLAFHGFRHTLGTALKLNSVPLDLIASITGHSDDDEKKSYPVLQKHYLHLSTPKQRSDQLAALDGFNPVVGVPRYVRGQFAEKLGADAKTYP